MSSEFFLVVRGATAVRNRTVHDSRLSFQALGLLMVMLALPPGAPLGYRAFTGRNLGEKAVRTAIRELESCGYRWRFRVRRAGVLRTLTVVFDEPVDVERARAAAQEAAGTAVESCLSVVDDDRAAAGAARCDQRKHETVPRSTVPRSTAARSGAAHRAKALSKGSSLRSEPLPSIQPPETPSPPGGRTGGVSDEDRVLVAECLPPAMAALADSGITLVAPRLRELVEAGWRPGEIRDVLGGVALPEQTRSMPHLVAHRLSEISPEAAPSVLRQARRRDAYRARVPRAEPAAETAEERHELAATALEAVRSIAARSPEEGEKWAARVGVAWPLPEAEEATA